MNNRPIIYLDNFTTFNDKQTEKVNSMIRSQYNRFLNKTFQPFDKAEVSNAAIAQSGRINSVTAVEYNNTGFASFQMIALGMFVGTDYPILQTNHKIKDIICYGGSSYVEMYDDITDWGYFFAKDDIIYFRLTRDPETILFPYCNITWSY